MNLQSSVLIIVTLVTFSCGENREKEVKRIDELVLQLQEIENKFKNIDSIDLFSVHSKVQADLKEFHLITDTLDNETVKKIQEAYPNLSQINFAAINYNNLASEIAFSKTQLNNLQQDVSNGLFETVKLNDVINEEQQFLLNLNQVLDSTYTNLNEQLEQTKKGYSTIDSIVNYYSKLTVNK
ncbi:MAG: hypothetical protein HYU68_08270 [Bacteroidetes bacterium]|nr:hypothetical protein [Bacteroidota bacterium]